MPGSKRTYKEKMKTYSFFTKANQNTESERERQQAEMRGVEAILAFMEMPPAECQELLRKLQSPKNWAEKIANNPEFKERMIKQACVIFERAFGIEEVELTFCKLMSEKFGKSFVIEISKGKMSGADLETLLSFAPSGQPSLESIMSGQSSSSAAGSSSGSTQPGMVSAKAPRKESQQPRAIPAPSHCHCTVRQTPFSRLAALEAKTIPKIQPTNLISASAAMDEMEQILINMNTPEAQKGLELFQELRTFSKDCHTTLEKFRLFKEENADILAPLPSLTTFFSNIQFYYQEGWAKNKARRARVETQENNDVHYDEIPSVCEPQRECYLCKKGCHYNSLDKKQINNEHK